MIRANTRLLKELETIILHKGSRPKARKESAQIMGSKKRSFRNTELSN
ncbi:MAG: hypothetical protein Q6354_01330 [Candidatus Brocadiales bacterium]|nr:hypothetical protein [Candidatus Brocadiales bacterium]